jgi:hypothetical protein
VEGAAAVPPLAPCHRGDSKFGNRRPDRQEQRERRIPTPDTPENRSTGGRFQYANEFLTVRKIMAEIEFGPRSARRWTVTLPVSKLQFLMANQHTRLDRMLDWLKDHPIAAWVTIIAIVLIGIGNLAAALNDVRDLFTDRDAPTQRLDQPLPPICRFILVSRLFTPSRKDADRRTLTFANQDHEWLADRNLVIALKNYDSGAYPMEFWWSRYGSRKGVATLTEAVYYVWPYAMSAVDDKYLSPLTENEAERLIYRFRFSIPACDELAPGITWLEGPATEEQPR